MGEVSRRRSAGQMSPGILAIVRVSTTLRLPDSCVLLVAEQTHGTVVTSNDRLADAAGERGLAVRDR